MARPPGRSLPAVIITRARLTGRPPSTLVTRPLMRAVATTAVAAGCADVSRDGRCCAVATAPTAATSTGATTDSARRGFMVISLDRYRRDSVDCHCLFKRGQARLEGQEGKEGQEGQEGETTEIRSVWRSRARPTLLLPFPTPDPIRGTHRRLRVVPRRGRR